MLRERIVPTLRSWFLAHGQGLVAAYLFGSVARGQDRRDSDVDLAVVLGRRKGPVLEDLDRLALMQRQLGDLLQRDVDLVPLDGASPDLRHHVLADHVLLLDAIMTPGRVRDPYATGLRRPSAILARLSQAVLCRA